MNEFHQFSLRYHKVKQGVKELAEQALTRALSAESEAAAAVLKLDQKRTEARAAQARGNTIDEWTAWERHIEWLDTQMISCRQLHEKKVERSGFLRNEVIAAFVEQKRWETIVENHAKEHRATQKAEENRTLDEQASIRFGRER
jgi:flagellar export protein FliJ